MQVLVLTLMVVVTMFEYLGQIGLFPRQARYLYEILAAFLLLYVAIMGVRTRFRDIRAPYFFLFGAILLVVICGLILNTVAPGPIFAGLRNYLRPIPLFFLPAVLAFTDTQLKTQLRLLLAIALIQIPTAVMQRLGTISRGGVTGDETVGTLQNSAFLSLFEIGGICLITAWFLRKRLSLPAFLSLFLLLIFPTTINETKATFVLLPLGLMVVFQVLAAPGTRTRNFMIGIAMIAIFAATFVPIYDYLNKEKQYSTDITDFFTQENQVGSYLDKNAQLGITTSRQVGRLDSILVPIKALAKDPSHLIFGLGIGNASDSALGQQFVGPYFQMFQYFLQSNFARLVLELGVLGVGLVMLLYWMIYKDSLVVAASDQELRGALAAGWAGFTTVIVISNFYKDLVPSDALSCLFWYYSGLIAAHRMRLAYAAKQRTPERPVANTGEVSRFRPKNS